MDLNRLVRKNIQSLKAYSSARDEFKGEASVYLDANENPLNGPYNRYPDPLQWKLKERVSKLKGVEVDKIFFGNGSDEPIDIVYRVFCEPGKDNVVAIDPSYGMYKVCADINNVEYRQVLLNDDYSLNADLLLKKVDEQTKLIFLCSPNNPSANILDKSEVLKVLTSFKGIVIIDEAYIDFSIENSWLPDLDTYPNLIVLQTFSKAWGLAAIRLGMAFASVEIISYFNKVKYPYNINILTQNFVLEELNKTSLKEEWVKTLIAQREWLNNNLGQVSFVEKIYPSDANFILVKVKDANKTYNSLVEKGIIVRNRNSISLCRDCLRITVGTESENKILIESLKSL
ncbi:histidinol-phosphate transaminase [Dysgonomonas capnocytophagoides]|uniref:Histidinol-phosphate aminotransferase n=1 Tax=Dysgonomonas capnocytophagoides TaxID=45254 RepID=A0A4Y8L224_9BACT|nr:histidinol-phosphate transaminase [Dysgonomonas capnocytophagoides]TFD95552.1 histidinol-phosphate transaminase [Dysgonomonas capnocytophagoides]